MIDYSPVFALVLFFVTLGLSMRPVRNLGILNVLFSMVGVVVSLYSLALENPLPFHPWFSITWLVVCCVCIWVGWRGGLM